MTTNTERTRFCRRGGRYLEDFRVGDIHEHRPGRTLSEADNTWFTLLTMNTHPLHFDHEYAKLTEFKRPLIVSTLTVSILVGMSVSDISEMAIANLGWTDIELPHPVFAGDTLYAESEVLLVRESKSRPHAGIVEVKTRGFNQENELICQFRRSALIPKRGYAVQDRHPMYGGTS